MRALLFLLFAIVPCLACAEAFDAHVFRVTDGDTIKVRALTGGREIKVRLARIDAPEGGQAFGQVAKRAMSDLVFGKDVRLVPQPRPDRYGRMIADIFVGDLWVNLEMVRLGLAWQYLLFDQSSELRAAQEEAQSAGRGLWIDRQAVPPWEWRKARKG